ncbi:MAG: hypothetical protein KDK72_10615, partial [Chlamydiia bacterium]|nr:hypothetical protein [Chlamydiia bacterium]
MNRIGDGQRRVDYIDELLCNYAKKGAMLGLSAIQIYSGMHALATNDRSGWQSLKGACLTAAGTSSLVYSFFSPANKVNAVLYIESMLNGTIAAAYAFSARSLSQDRSLIYRSQMYFISGVVSYATKSYFSDIFRTDEPSLFRIMFNTNVPSDATEKSRMWKEAVISGTTSLSSALTSEATTHILETVGPLLKERLIISLTMIGRQIGLYNLKNLAGEATMIALRVLRPAANGFTSSASGKLGGNTVRCLMNKERLTRKKVLEGVPQAAIGGAVYNVALSLGIEHIRRQYHLQKLEEEKQEWMKEQKRLEKEEETIKEEKKELEEEKEGLEARIQRINRKIEESPKIAEDLDQQIIDKNKDLERHNRYAKLWAGKAEKETSLSEKEIQERLAREYSEKAQTDREELTALNTQRSLLDEYPGLLKDYQEQLSPVDEQLSTVEEKLESNATEQKTIYDNYESNVSTETNRYVNLPAHVPDETGVLMATGSFMKEAAKFIYR